MSSVPLYKNKKNAKTEKDIPKKKRNTRKNKNPPIKSSETPEIIQVPMKSNNNPQPLQPFTDPKKQSLKKRQPLEKSELVKMFLEMLTTIKLYHWNTHSYSRHKATDELHEKLSELVDQFVEVMQGKMFSPNRIHIINSEILAYTPETKTKMVDKILFYIEKLQILNKYFSTTKDSDLLNIRDEMLSHLNQFLYLFSFDEI
jgi:DNA-binding ferritin-like protein